MNAFFSFIDRVVDEQAELVVNQLSIPDLKRIDVKILSRKLTKAELLQIVKKNATHAILRFIEAAKRKEIAELAAKKLERRGTVFQRDDHHGGNYASLKIDIDLDSDEAILEKGLSVVSKDWKSTISLGNTAEQLKDNIKAIGALERLDVKGRLAHVNGAMSIYITESRKARILEWVKWRLEDVVATEAQSTTDEEVEGTEGEQELPGVKAIAVEEARAAEGEVEGTESKDKLGKKAMVELRIEYQGWDNCTIS